MDPAAVREELLRRGFSPAVADDMIQHWHYRIADAESAAEFIDRWLPSPMSPKVTDVGLRFRFRSEGDRLRFMTLVRELPVRLDWPWREGQKFEDTADFVVEFWEGT